ncbi:winged helix-turn-helix domain-containing protein [Streptosporangium sp. KLBMP 9127]|nr:winged helix-turn-helix domain-containing protein [Streptosporangium sp. KLBMP 9127]
MRRAPGDVRFHLSSDDLANVRVRGPLGPLAETMFAMCALHRPDHGAVQGEWRRRSLRSLSPAGACVMRFLTPASRIPFDLAALAGHTPDIDEALDTVRTAPDHWVREELEALPNRHILPAPVRGLADNDRQARLALMAAVRACHQATVAPYWDRIHTHLHAETVHAAMRLATDGLSGLLERQRTRGRWRPPYLDVPLPRQGQDVHLGGRGLDIYVSVFSHDLSMLIPADQHSSFTLVLPTSPDPGTALALWTSPQGSAHRRLAALLGPTRAAVLEAIAEGRGTGQIARHLSISSASASQHATVLREAGLIATSRHRNTVLHTLTPLGTMLLNGRTMQRSDGDPSATR